MQHIDLFSGIGGFALAARWCGLKTVAFCEIDKFCQKVLTKNFPGVPIYDDVRTFPSDKYPRPFLLTGGFPCQPYSVAGLRRGAEDDRALWPTMLEVIKTCRPTWVLGENVAGFVSMGLDQSLSDLEAAGYSTQAFIIPACGVNAQHRRDRGWIVAHAAGAQDDGIRRNHQRGRDAVEWDQQTAQCEDGQTYNNRSCGCGEIVPHTHAVRKPQSTIPRKDIRLWAGNGGETHADSLRSGCQELHTPGIAARPGYSSRRVNPSGPDWSTQSPFCGVAYGIPGRVDRLKSLGNAIVPQVAYEIIAAMVETE